MLKRPGIIGQAEQVGDAVCTQTFLADVGQCQVSHMIVDEPRRLVFLVLFMTFEDVSEIKYFLLSKGNPSELVNIITWLA